MTLLTVDRVTSSLCLGVLHVVCQTIATQSHGWTWKTSLLSQKNATITLLDGSRNSFMEPVSVFALVNCGFSSLLSTALPHKSSSQLLVNAPGQDVSIGKHLTSTFWLRSIFSKDAKGDSSSPHDYWWVGLFGLRRAHGVDETPRRDQSPPKDCRPPNNNVHHWINWWLYRYEFN